MDGFSLDIIKLKQNSNSRKILKHCFTFTGILQCGLIFTNENRTFFSFFQRHDNPWRWLCSGFEFVDMEHVVRLQTWHSP